MNPWLEKGIRKNHRLIQSILLILQRMAMRRPSSGSPETGPHLGGEGLSSALPPLSAPKELWEGLRDLAERPDHETGCQKPSKS